MTVEVSANGYVIETIEIGERVSLVPGPPGPAGATGPVGPQGVQGLQGQPGAVGPAGLTWRGAWSVTTDYVADDAVGYEGASWFAAEDPPVGEVPSGTSLYWQLLAAQGAQGAQGVQGPQGLQGVQGEVGPQGPAGQDAAASTWKSNADSTAIIPVDNADSWIVGSDRMDRDTADTTKDIRALFDKAKGAFRAGRASAGYWDAVDRALYSFAAGDNVRAWAQASHAEGTLTQAGGTSSHAEGSGTSTSGPQSHAEGLNTSASGNQSHAEGSGTSASGYQSHAEGASTTASGQSSHAEGEETISSGVGSHAEGRFNTASGTAAHAEGSDNNATGVLSHAEGSWALASRYAQRAKASGTFSTKGDAQASQMVLRKTTTDATATVLTANDQPPVLTGVGTSVLTLTASRTHKFRVDVAARRTDVAGEAAGWSFEGVIARDASGNAYFVGTVEGKAWGTTNAAAWDVTLSINTTDATNNYLAITATGQAAKTIRWVAELNTVEVG